MSNESLATNILEYQSQYWGYHLILNCRSCDIESIKNKDLITKFAKTLVKEIDMVAYGEPQVVNFGSGNKEGFTLVQLIETSNICAHFCNDTGDVYLDVFSCKPFSINKVKAHVYKYFSPVNMNTNYLERQA